MPRLSVPLTDDQHAAIRRKAGALGVPQAEVARRLLLAWANDEIDMPIPNLVETLDRQKLVIDGGMAVFHHAEDSKKDD